MVSLSDLSRHPELKFGFSNEFMDRADGWPGMRDRYGLPQRDVRGLDHDLAYRALASGEIQATDLYSTDAEIRQYNLRVLRDDLGFFPVVRVRLALSRRSEVAIARGLRGPGAAGGTDHRGRDGRDECPGQARSRARRPRRGRFPRGRSSGSRSRSRRRRSSGDCSGGSASTSTLVAISLAAAIAGRRSRWASIAARRPRLGAVHPDHDRRDPDDPFAGAPGVHDPLAGDRGQARPGRALSLQPAADRPQHGHGPARHPGLAARIGRGPGLARRAHGCSGSSCRWPRARSWRGSRRPR